jgi:hypothetical protein
MFRCCKPLLTLIENQLRTPKQRDPFPLGFIRHFGVPYLGGPSAVDALNKASNA